MLKDRVRLQGNSNTGIVYAYETALARGGHPAEDMVSVRWDDGTMPPEAVNQPASRFVLISRI